ncbi:CidA/LrgA family protein [Paenibacillus physcomitrellae]|uniref:Holin-like protein CidA n=1 Tax=Paenibacillus physcomitrellae TaxID=1619311 RepID=A0ABQ1FU03_9BACL|nr:CidA/LrgA family holin-like protein [Paenibacillus physcomitrellae]GGA30703.1 holin-like protein CidA [Paenibacillus physcomitrellae]
MTKTKTLLIGIVQVAVLFLISMAMNKVTELLHLKIPGSILGIIVVFILLQTKVIKLAWIERGANWLLAELLLFFIPSAVGIMQYIPMLENDGLQILLVVIFSTVIVMLSSGIVASRITKRKENKSA